MRNINQIRVVFLWAVVLSGLGVAAVCLSSTPITVYDSRLVVLAGLTLFTARFITVQILRTTSRVSASDTFIFLTLFLYGGQVAVPLAACEAILASLGFSRKPSTYLFNGGAVALSTFLSWQVVRLFFGPLSLLPSRDINGEFVIAVATLALVQYITNSGLVAVLNALRSDGRIWQSWKTFYLWTSLSYFVGASAAAVIAKLILSIGFWALLIVAPMVMMIFVTYRTYAQNLEVSRERAEVAEKHLLEKERLIEQAENAARLKDEFLAVLSHELRTPLTAICGWSDLLLEFKLGPEETLAGIETIKRNANAQAKLVDDILDLSRIISGKMKLDFQPLDLDGVISAALDSAAQAARAKKITLEVGPLPPGLSIEGDPERLQQVVWNLLTNAIKFTAEGGRVSVKATHDAGRATVRVSDTGIGIAKDFQPYVFDRFRQADASMTRQHSGLGIGLSIVKQIVEMHGGQCAVFSEGEGLGSTFSFSIPASVAPSPFPVRTSTANIEVSLSGRSILLVEDDPDTNAMLAFTLRRAGAEVLPLLDAPTALELLLDWRPDLIVSDLRMPGMDGCEFIRRVHEGCYHIPAIALSAHTRKQDRERVLQSGFSDFINKPVEPAKLVAHISNFFLANPTDEQKKPAASAPRTSRPSPTRQLGYAE